MQNGGFFYEEKKKLQTVSELYKEYIAFRTSEYC